MRCDKLQVFREATKHGIETHLPDLFIQAGIKQMQQSYTDFFPAV